MRSCKDCLKSRHHVARSGRKYQYCVAYDEMIGYREICCGWTDDPSWEEKIKESSSRYRLHKKRRGKGKFQ
ncbi:MAG: hypothetical protein D5R97_00545 [Candidatus Syntrophonatronum acetioxidans]|uniref:Uncharacterized protein n=1 Tax=Candidatus Syntrophonatronum acetioxidans TaxID=1795816 RepID=A0A424YIS0_9FIRM|nr:MAG: hypothetical protein D5R97_00545 [Candidatus Syntrophonatronum acetioxidans]